MIKIQPFYAWLTLTIDCQFVNWKTRYFWYKWSHYDKCYYAALKQYSNDDITEWRGLATFSVGEVFDMKSLDTRSCKKLVKRETLCNPSLIVHSGFIRGRKKSWWIGYSKVLLHYYPLISREVKTPASIRKTSVNYGAIFLKQSLSFKWNLKNPV